MEYYYTLFKVMENASDRLKLYLFGAPLLEQSGRPVHLGRRKAMGLLAYMAFSKREYHRDTLAALFWPDYDDSHARGSLRRLLSQVRKAVGSEILPLVEELVGPSNLERMWVDIEEFQGLMAQVRQNQRISGEETGDGLGQTATKELLRGVVDLYRGDFMAGFTLGECGQFSDWQFFQGEYLRRELCVALENLVSLCEEEGEHEEGIAFGQRLVEVDPLNEEAHCALMRLYGVSGQREAGLRQYRLCARLLKEEMGLEPEESTEELYQTIRQSRPVRRIEGPEKERRGKPRLVVLPFRSLKEEQEWLGDGMTDELITELSRREELEVISYTSSSRYENTEKSLRQIAAELDVDYLLEGTVLRAGGEMRVSAQLIEAVSESHIWAESYRGSFADILELQERIAGPIAAQVVGELAPGRVKTAVREIDPEAREACMMGDYLLRRSQSEEEIAKAKNYYQEAIDKDPRCADAFAGLAFTYFSLGGYGRDFKPYQKVRDRVDRLIQRALEIDPGNVRGHMVLGGLRLEWDWDWAGAEREFQEVLQINPNHIESLNWYSELKMIFCKFDQLFHLLQKAYRLDPLDMVTLVHLHRYYVWMFQFRRSLQILDRFEELYPGRIIIHHYRAWVYLLMRRYESVIIHGEKALSASGMYPYARGFVACAYGKLGKKGKALQMIEKMIEEREQQKHLTYYIALACYGVGMDDEALRWLEQCYQDHYVGLTHLAHRFVWGEMHWDPRFQNILRRMGIPLQLEYIRRALDRLG
jgi:TolB-like protein